MEEDIKPSKLKIAKSIVKSAIKHPFPSLYWTLYKDKDEQVYLVVYRMRFKKMYWSRHFAISHIASDRGIINDMKDEDRLNDYLKRKNAEGLWKKTSTK